MGEIHTVVGLAVESANRQARHLSLEQGEAIAVVTHDRSGVLLSWASVPQSLLDNEKMVGRWKAGVRRDA